MNPLKPDVHKKNIVFLKFISFPDREHLVRSEEKYCALGNNAVWPDVKEARIGRTYYFRIPPLRLKHPM